MIRAKRAYDPPTPTDGRRILVDRLWPQGLTKSAAALDSWRRELAPSDQLRTWFAHDPAKFSRFRERYRSELLEQREALDALAQEAARGPVTLVYAARDPLHCNATVLKELLEEILRGERPAPHPRGGGVGRARHALGARTPPATRGADRR